MRVNLSGAGMLERGVRSCCAIAAPWMVLLLMFAEARAGDYFYTNVDGALTITGYIGPGGNITIPSTIDDLPVTGIGVHAFGFRTNLTGVTIPNGITNIGSHAFNQCSMLTNATIGESVTSIGDSAFTGTDLTSVTVPNSVARIGSRTFTGCYRLSAIFVGLSNPFYSSVDGVLFNRLLTILVAYPQGKAADYSIPNTVTSIGDNAFDETYSLTNVVIPTSVTNIGTRAFADTGLVTVMLPNGLVTIGNEAFSRCRAESVVIPNTVTFIGGYAFSESHNLTNVVIGNRVTDIGDGALRGTPLTAVTIPQSVVRLGYAFDACPLLTAINVAPLNPSYSSVGGVLFNKPKTELLFHPQGKAGDYAVPNTVTNVASSAFFGCLGVTNVLLPGSLISLGSQAFMECRNLASVNIPDSVSSLGIRAFATCTALPRITIGRSLTNIADQAFYACTRLTNVTFPDTLNRIGIRTFGQCYSLTNITIPASVTSFGDYAFIECFNLTGVYLQGDAPTPGAGMFVALGLRERRMGIAP